MARRKSRKKGSGRKKGLFDTEVKSHYWAKIMSIKDPRGARAACRALSKNWRNLTRAQKRKRIKYAVLAMNRAKAMLRRRSLSKKERAELKQVVAIYRKWIDRHRLTR